MKRGSAVKPRDTNCRVKPTPYFTARKPSKKVPDSGWNQVFLTEIGTLCQFISGPLIRLRKCHFLRQFLEQTHLPRMNHRLRFLIRLILQSTVICFSISVHCHQTIRLLAVVAGLGPVAGPVRRSSPTSLCACKRMKMGIEYCITSQQDCSYFRIPRNSIRQEEEERVRKRRG